MKHKKTYVSRKLTPWENNKERTSLQIFLQQNYRQHYYQKHDNEKLGLETDLVNSLTVSDCPHCGNAVFHKKGKNSFGYQRYICKGCYRKFTALTKTIFDGHKLSIAEWIEYLLGIFGYSSLSLLSKTNKNSQTTAKYWLAKLFLVLDGYQDNIVLKNTVWIDETLYKVVASDIQYRKDGKEFRGTSFNQYCIGTGIDIHKKVYIQIQGRGKTSEEKTLRCFFDHIEKGLILIHDKEKSHNILVDALNLKSKVYDAKKLKNIKDKENPLEPINKLHDFLKKFLNSHPGFKRDELQGYLNLFAFMTNEAGKPLEKVEKMLLLSLKKRKTLKYREYYAKKPDSNE